MRIIRTLDAIAGCNSRRVILAALFALIDSGEVAFVLCRRDTNTDQYFRPSARLFRAQLEILELSLMTGLQLVREFARERASANFFSECVTFEALRR